MIFCEAFYFSWLTDSEIKVSEAETFSSPEAKSPAAGHSPPSMNGRGRSCVRFLTSFVQKAPKVIEGKVGRGYVMSTFEFANTKVQLILILTDLNNL